MGDLGNIISDADGNATFEMVDEMIQLTGLYEIIGRGCVVHLSEDDLGETDNANSLKNGNAGTRIGCGVVGRGTMSDKWFGCMYTNNKVIS